MTSFTAFLILLHFTTQLVNWNRTILLLHFVLNPWSIKKVDLWRLWREAGCERTRRTPSPYGPDWVD